MLEQIAYQLPRISETKQRVYQVGDLESLSASALYSGDNIIRSKNGKSFFIPLKINGVPIHDTYDVDEYGNISNGHSTVNLPKNGKVYLPHSSLIKPTIRRGS